MDTLAVCRKIVGHFKHSSTAYSHLNTIQQNLGLPQYRLQQDVTCSLRYRIFYPPTVMTANQLDIVGKVITALSPIEEITKAVSANAASVSLIIQFVQMLSKTMEKHHDDKGVQTMKSEMLASLKGGSQTLNAL